MATNLDQVTPMASVDAAPLVLVTGASGYIASAVVKRLLDEGRVRVRGTVRSVEKWQKELELLARDDHKHKLELVSADLLKEDGWAAALDGVDLVLHMASPFPIDQPDDPMELIQPAVEGVEHCFRAAVQAGTVKRIVLTSSCAAVYTGNQDKMDEKTGVAEFDESSWTNEERAEAYSVSKTRAEKRFWELAKEYEESKIECVALNPSLVLGPLLFPRYSSSQEISRLLLQREFPFVPDTYIGIVHLDDVVQAHVRALTAEGVDGERFILSGETIAFVEYARILSAAFSDQYNPPTNQAPSFLLRIVGLCDKKVGNFVVPNLGFHFILNHNKAAAALGIEFKTAKDAILDITNDMVKHKLV